MFRKLTLIVVFIIACIAGFFHPVEAKTVQKSDWQIVKELCKNEHKKVYLIDANKTTDKQFWKIVDHRKGKDYIVVEKVVSVSDGKKHGRYSTKTKGTNYIIGYNKNVPKGKKVTSYVIWSPYSNECDDVLWVVDNHRYR